MIHKQERSDFDLLNDLLVLLQMQTTKIDIISCFYCKLPNQQQTKNDKNKTHKIIGHRRNVFFHLGGKKTSIFFLLSIECLKSHLE